MTSLRIFKCTDADRATEYTLRQAFEVYLLPDLLSLRRAKGTLQEYRGALTKWERYSSNAAVGLVQRADVEAWRDAVLREVSVPTVCKYWRQLRAIFRRIGPPDTGNPAGEGIISRVPYCPMPREDDPDPRFVSFEEIDALYHACGAARWPPPAETGRPADMLWQTFIVLAYNYGPRRRDLWELSWSGVNWKAGTIAFNAAKTGKRHRLPLNVTSRRALERIDLRPALCPSVFHPTRGNTQFYREWERINQKAGLAVPVGPHDLRDTCSTMYEDIWPTAGSWILQHAPRDVTRRHYLSIPAPVIAAIHALPQPAAFSS